MLASAGVKRRYGIVADALNPVIDALRRNGKIEFIHVRHEEYGVFAAAAEACLPGNPVVVCGTAGPGVGHLFNGLMPARWTPAPPRRQGFRPASTCRRRSDRCTFFHAADNAGSSSTHRR
jgi:glyoxylate carboligase